LSETVRFRIFHGKNAEQFSFQFGREILVLYDKWLLICPNVWTIYVFISDRDCIAHKENGLRCCSSDVVIT
jgi:hypothetical protein